MIEAVEMSDKKLSGVWDCVIRVFCDHLDARRSSPGSCAAVCPALSKAGRAANDVVRWLRAMHSPDLFAQGPARV
jgi:hypothetical protein